MLTNNYLIVSCTTKNSITFKKTPLYKSLKNLKGIHKKIFYSNKRGLGECYNEAIRHYKNKYKFMLFVHDDVEINDSVFREKLESGFKEFDVLGPVGTTKWKYGHPAVWGNNGGNLENYRGIICHNINNKLSLNEYGKFGFFQCIILDGLFIAVKTKCLDKVRFDTKFTFHHYDMDFCLEMNKNKFKIGVCPILMTHYSDGGDFINNPEWKKCNSLFLEKWK